MQAQQQPLMAEGQYHENIAYLAHQNLESVKQLARLTLHSQQLQGANESLSAQLKAAQEELKALKNPPLPEIVTAGPSGEVLEGAAPAPDVPAPL